jgi:hypothetical protein
MSSMSISCDIKVRALHIYHDLLHGCKMFRSHNYLRLYVKFGAAVYDNLERTLYFLVTLLFIWLPANRRVKSFLNQQLQPSMYNVNVRLDMGV